MTPKTQEVNKICPAQSVSETRIPQSYMSNYNYCRQEVPAQVSCRLSRELRGFGFCGWSWAQVAGRWLHRWGGALVAWVGWGIGGAAAFEPLKPLCVAITHTPVRTPANSLTHDASHGWTCFFGLSLPYLGEQTDVSSLPPPQGKSHSCTVGVGNRDGVKTEAGYDCWRPRNSC